MDSGGTIKFGLRFFLLWFVRLRWLAICSVVAALGLAMAWFEPGFRYDWLWSIVAAMVVHNLAVSRWLASTSRCDETFDCGHAEVCGHRDDDCVVKNRRIALVQINLDLLSLFLLLHFSGGLENPFLPFFVFHVVISGILLERGLALVEAGVASALVLALGLLEWTGALAHYHPTVLGATEPVHNWLYVVGIPAAYAVTFLITSYMTVFIMQEVRRRTTQIVDLSSELETKNRRLEQIDRMRRRLLAIASHDLKSPMAAISSYLMLLTAGYLGPLTDKQKEVLQKSLDRLQGLKEFVTDILDVTAIEKGQLHQDMERTDLKEILLGCVEDHRDRAREAGVDLVLEVPDTLPMVDAAPTRMAQVFNNLLSNAIKYSPDGGQVTVAAGPVPKAEVDRALRARARLDPAAYARSAEQDDTQGTSQERCLVFSVSDRGIGMSEEDLDHLFEEFFRSENARGRGIEGTGLGLYLCRLIVTAHHGRIWATSQPGQGSTFHVAVPIPQEEVG